MRKQQNPLGKTILTLGGLILGMASSTQATLFKSIDGENASVNSNNHIIDNGDTFKTSVQGSVATTTFSSTAYKGSKSVRVKVNSGSNSSNSRLEYKLDDNNKNLSGKTRYMGFALKRDSGTWPPPTSEWFTIAQFLEEFSGSNPDGPRHNRFSVQMDTDNNSTDLVFLFKDPDSGAWTTLATHSWSNNEWKRIVMRMTFSTSSSQGRVQAWVNGTKLFDVNRKTQTNSTVDNTVKFGIYRGPGTDSGHALLFDEVRYASTFDEANPDNSGGSSSSSSSSSGSAIR